MFLNDQHITEEIKREIKKFLEKNDNENMTTQNMTWSESSSKREIYINTILPQATKETSSRQPSVTPKTTGKRRTKNTQN